MPELPEVETVRRGLEPLIGHRIVGCDVRRRDVVRDRTRPTPNPRRGVIDAAALGVGYMITDLLRRGKQLAMAVERETQQRVVLIQLGMSGQVTLVNTPRIPQAKHVHAVWTLNGGQRIAFRDPRRFGGIKLLSDLQSLKQTWDTLGPDALTIQANALGNAISASRRMIKAALLDQSVLAGVGNIYADEALHRSGIDPRAFCDTLTPERTRLLAESIRGVLSAAVDARGSTLRDYRDASSVPGEAQLLHRVYNRAGQACPGCGHAIASTRIAQRSTCWCPSCQR